MRRRIEMNLAGRKALDPKKVVDCKKVRQGVSMKSFFSLAILVLLPNTCLAQSNTLSVIADKADRALRSLESSDVSAARIQLHEIRDLARFDGSRSYVSCSY